MHNPVSALGWFSRLIFSLIFCFVSAWAFEPNYSLYLSGFSVRFVEVDGVLGFESISMCSRD